MLLVLYGSQNGCAEAVAQRIAAEAEQRGWSSELKPGNSFKKLQQGKFCEYEHVVIVSSTTGKATRS